MSRVRMYLKLLRNKFVYVFTLLYVLIFIISAILLWFIFKYCRQWFNTFRNTVLIFACILGIVVPTLTFSKSFVLPNLNKIQNELIPLIKENKIESYNYEWFMAGCMSFIVDNKDYCQESNERIQCTIRF